MKRRHRHLVTFATVLLVLGTAAAHLAQADTPAQEVTRKLVARQLMLIEKLASIRADYERSLNEVIAFYETTGETYKLKLAKKELKALRKTPQPEYIVLAETLVDAKAIREIPAANRMFQDALHYDKLASRSRRDENRQLALERFLDVMRRFPESNRIDDAAYCAGRIYEGHLKNYHKAMIYYRKCYEWNPVTVSDARIRAARMAYHKLHDKPLAKLLYREAALRSPESADRREAEGKLTLLKAMGY